MNDARNATRATTYTRGGTTITVYANGTTTHCTCCLRRPQSGGVYPAGEYADCIDSGK